MAYITPADMRSATLAEHAAGLALSTTDVSNAGGEALLLATIAGVSQRIDDLTNDHFESLSATYELRGDGTSKLTLPQRCTAVSIVQLRDATGALFTQPSSVYRLESSLNAAGSDRTFNDATDFISIVPFQYLTVVDSSADPTRWPEGANQVHVEGTFGWTVTPRDIKRLAALLVFDTWKPLDGRLRRARTITGDGGSYDYDTASGPTGITEADQIIANFLRQPAPAVG